MKLGMRRQVDNRITIVAIIIVLGIVQAAWWKGLIWQPKARAGAGMQGPSGRGPDLVLNGHEDIVVDTLAGSPEPGWADGPGRQARFDGPTGIAIDPDGNIIVADCRNHRIRKITPKGKTETVAGGDAGYADGPASGARFNLPNGVAIAPDGTIYVADTGNHKVRAIKSGQVTTIAGSTEGDSDGAGAQARFDTPVAAAWQNAGKTVAVADALNRKIKQVSSDGRTASLPRLAGYPVSISFGKSSLIAVQNQPVLMENGIAKSYPLGTSGIILNSPLAVCASEKGYYLSDSRHSALFEIQNGVVDLMAGICKAGRPLYGYRDDTGNRAGFGIIAGIATDHKGHIYVSDILNNCIRRVTLPVSSPDAVEVGRF